jgi:general stress protein 26
MSDAEQELREKFWKALDDSPFMMLGLQNSEDALTRPMTAQVDDEQIWFFGAKSENLVKNLQRSNRAIATYTSKDHKLFASVHGTLELSNDREVIDRLWNPIIASWFKDGKDDADLALLRFNTTSADIWEAHTGSTLKAAVLSMLGRDPGKQEQNDNRAEVAL